jgi:hypothetical protein
MDQPRQAVGDADHGRCANGDENFCHGVRSLTHFQLTDEEKAQIRARITALEVEHSDLDYIIATLSQDPIHDQLRLRRLKKRKLMLKDQISALKDRLIPDIIA